MSDAHARQYYYGANTETNEGSGTIDTYVEQAPAILGIPATSTTETPQPGLNAPVTQDKKRGSS